jgi:hypothetical protein
MKADGTSVSRAEFEKNLYLKQQDRIFRQDISTLLSETYESGYDIDSAFGLVHAEIVSKLPKEA